MKDRLGHPIYCDQCEAKTALFAFKSRNNSIDLKDRPLPEGVTIYACGSCSAQLINKKLKEK